MVYSIFRLENKIKIRTVIEKKGHNVKNINRENVETFFLLKKNNDDVKKYKQRNVVIVFS